MNMHAHTRTHTHTHTLYGTCTHKQTDYTKLSLHNSKWAASRDTRLMKTAAWNGKQGRSTICTGACHHSLRVSAAKHCCWKVYICSYKYAAQLCSNNFTVRSCRNRKQFCSSKKQLCSDIHTFAATNMLHFTSTILLLAAVKTGSGFAAAKINFAVTNILLFLQLQNS